MAREWQAGDRTTLLNVPEGEQYRWVNKKEKDKYKKGYRGYRPVTKGEARMKRLLPINDPRFRVLEGKSTELVERDGLCLMRKVDRVVISLPKRERPTNDLTEVEGVSV